MASGTQVSISLKAYAKLLSHVVQYPYTAVNGVLLTHSDKSEDGELEVVDAVPLFHVSLGLSPMLIVALTQIEEYASNKSMKICGYYHANEYHADNEVGAIATKIADKIADNSDQCCLLMVDNEKLSHLTTDLPFRALVPSDSERVEWRPAPKPKLQYGEKGMLLGFEIVKEKLYRDVIDMDNHYDNVKLHWKNVALEEIVQMYLQSIIDAGEE